MFMTNFQIEATAELRWAPADFPPVVVHWGIAEQRPAAHCWQFGQSLSVVQDSEHSEEAQVVPLAVQSLLPVQQPPNWPVRLD